MTIAAVPLNEVDQRCAGCCSSRASSSPACCSRWASRRTHRAPRAAPAGPHRPTARRSPAATSSGAWPAEQRTEVGGSGCAQRDARAPRAGLRRAPGERGPPAAVPRRRLARAAHAAGRDPRLRRAARLGAATRPAEREAMRRIGRRRRGWGCSSRTSSRSPAWTRSPSRRRAGRPRALARDAADDARATAPGARDRGRCPGPAVVAGDPHQLRQVLANLLRNALVHTPAGTPVEIAVAGGRRRGAQRPRPRPRAAAGAGAALFERFWRAEAGRGRGRAGAGLGLAIVAGIVEAHGGRSAPRRPGRGRHLQVRLPAAD